MITARFTTLVVAAVMATGFSAIVCSLAGEPQIAATRVTSSDATSRFIALGVSKSVVIDFRRTSRTCWSQREVSRMPSCDHSDGSTSSG
jgi:hypothetical protein